MRKVRQGAPQFTAASDIAFCMHVHGLARARPHHFIKSFLDSLRPVFRSLHSKHTLNFQFELSSQL